MTPMDPMMSRLLASLTLSETGAATFRAPRAHDGPGAVVFGGELLGQAIVAAARALPGKRVRSVHAVFSRGADPAKAVDISVERLHDGRTTGSAAVTFAQDARRCAHALALLDVGEPDLVRHQRDMPDVAPPDEALAVSHPAAAPATIVVDDVDVRDPALTGPPALRLWIRFPGAPAGETALAQALLAFATDGWLIGTAMRPHAGIGQSMAHRELATAVLSHTLSFHGDLDAAGWHLIDHESVHAGGGRCHGRGAVFTVAGDLVASFTQDALLRRATGGRP
jgi:acyl-CoA thioesterase II